MNKEIIKLATRISEIIREEMDPYCKIVIKDDCVMLERIEARSNINVK